MYSNDRRGSEKSPSSNPEGHLILAHHYLPVLLWGVHRFNAHVAILSAGATPNYDPLKFVS